ncbi:MAG TPA: hypothetical protein VNC22_22930 [Sporichthya sp.]|nr:hypothetical protein [Sporichthya sp.]
MTTIHKDIVDLLTPGSGFASIDATNILEALGIDPDADEHSILVLQRPECPTCDGGSIVDPVDPRRSLMPSLCPTCKGTGYVPAHVEVPTPGWDTKTRCACGSEFTSRCEFWKHQADAYVAACRAVQEAQP